MTKKAKDLGGLQDLTDTIRVERDVPLDTETLPPGVVSVADAARWLGVSDETLRRYITAGRIDAQVEEASGRQGWRWVITTEELNRLRRLSVKVVRTQLPLA